MSDPAAAPPSPAPRRSVAARTRIALAALAGLLAVVAALGLAAALNDPVGAGGRDATPAMPDPVPGANPGTDAGLPPLALVLDRPPPDGIGNLEPTAQLPRMEALAVAGAPARRFVELGAVLQVLGFDDRAGAAFRTALEREPGNLGARVGLALVSAASGEAMAMDSADARLADIEREHPDAQIVSFNRAWLAIYRADAEGARVGLMRTVRLDSRSPLGQAAASLLNALAGMSGSGAANP